MTDYEAEYRKGRGICGEPFKEFVAFFDQFPRKSLRVLDLGCGQGRDALFIARLGHTVVGVDVSKTGIGQMVEDARREGLSVEGVVADLIDYKPAGLFDAVILDRVLHMMKGETARLDLLEKAAHHMRKDGYVLIADVPSNRNLIVGFFDGRSGWSLTRSTKSITFANYTKTQ